LYPLVTVNLFIGRFKNGNRVISGKIKEYSGRERA
jgi:hypothetical protein